MGVWAFLKVRKKFWLLPIAAVLALVLLLLLLGQESPEEFVYMLF